MIKLDEQIKFITNRRNEHQEIAANTDITSVRDFNMHYFRQYSAALESLKDYRRIRESWRKPAEEPKRIQAAAKNTSGDESEPGH